MISPEMATQLTVSPSFSILYPVQRKLRGNDIAVPEYLHGDAIPADALNTAGEFDLMEWVGRHIGPGSQTRALLDGTIAGLKAQGTSSFLPSPSSHPLSTLSFLPLSLFSQREESKGARY